jgi:FG-GAP repeat protein
MIALRCLTPLGVNLALVGGGISGAFAAQDVTFEVTDFNSLQSPTFSGSTVEITLISYANQFSGDANDILNPSDGEQGSACCDCSFSFNTSLGWPDSGGALVRITDYPDRHILSEPDPTSGIGVYFKYDGAAGDIEISLTIHEAPPDTGDNETYESTPWRRVSGGDSWQYLHWTFSEITSGESNWGARVVGGTKGDGIYDGGGEGDTTGFEAILIRPFAGTTSAGVPLSIRFDDIHTGDRHTPLGEIASHPIDLGEVGVGSVPGVRLDGDPLNETAGISLSGVGDVNGDGLSDCLVASTRPVFGAAIGTFTPEAHLIYGTSSEIASGGALDLSSLDGINGVRVGWDELADHGEVCVAGAGDVNGDGLDDFLLGVGYADPNDLTDAGETVLVYGASAELGESGLLDLSQPYPFGWVHIPGVVEHTQTGISVSGAGDFNGDGHDDFLIGSPRLGSAGGRAYLIFGSEGVLGASGVFDLSTVDGTNGLKLVHHGRSTGLSVSGAGDVNGDGLDDVLIGNITDTSGSPEEWGEAILVYGTSAPPPSGGTVDLSLLDGDNGVLIRGHIEGGAVGSHVSAAGDIDADGLSDILIGAPATAQSASPPIPGSAYLIFGDPSGVGRMGFLSTGDLDGESGFQFVGAEPLDITGLGVAGGFDLDSDGFPDLIAGAPTDAPAGACHLVYGPVEPPLSGGEVSLATLDGTWGTTFQGIDPDDWAGLSVSAAGDFNGDGRSDLLIGAPLADPGSAEPVGEAYLIWGFGALGETTHRSHSPSGSAAMRGIGLPGDGSFTCPLSRCWVGFDSGLGSGTDGASLQTVTLTRSDSQISGLGDGSLIDVANAMWRVQTDRVGQTEMSIALRYLDREIAGLNEEELELHMAPAPNGPWLPVEGLSAWPERNELHCTIPGALNSVYLAIAEEPGLMGSPPEVVDLALPIGQEGRPVLRVYGDDPNDHLGSGGHGGIAFGDLNGDGLDDMVIGARGASFDPTRAEGIAYVIWGTTESPSDPVDLNEPAGTHGETRIIGDQRNSNLGWAVMCGDFNGDGIDDAALSETSATVSERSWAGKVSIVFGRDDLPGTVLQLQSVGQPGVAQIHGEEMFDGLGTSLAVGDVNGDGIEDLVIGASGRSNSSGSPTLGRAYVVYGRRDLPGQSLDLRIIPEMIGTTRILADDEGDDFGYAAACADLNGDDSDDVIIGAYEASGQGNLPGDVQTGEVHILWGGPDLIGQTIDLDTDGAISAAGETRIFGAHGFSFIGFSLATGDVDADGLDDLVIGAIAQGPEGRSIAGLVYVIWGDPILPGQTMVLDATSVSSSAGEARILGAITETRLGWSVASSDIDGDGFDDVIATAPGHIPPDYTETGTMHVIRGGPSLRGAVLDLRDDWDDIRVLGINNRTFFGTAGEAGGDFNRDGFPEFAAAAYDGDNPNIAQTDDYAGWAAMVHGGGEATVATVRERLRAGPIPRAGLGGRLSPAMRSWIGFESGADDTGGVSTVTATLTRSSASIENIQSAAAAHWEIVTDRQAFGSAQVTFQFTDDEVDGFTEEDLRLFQAPSPEGPWSLVPPQALHPLRNEITARVEHLGFFAIADTGLGGDAHEVDSPSNPVPLSPETPLVRSISGLGDQDWMRIDLDSHQHVSLAVLGAGADLHIGLHDITDAPPGSTGTLIAEDVGTDAVIPETSLPPGAYLLSVEDEGGDQVIHTYVVSMISEPWIGDLYEEDDSPSQPSVITAGEMQTRSIAPVADPDWVTFSLEASSEVTARISGATGDLVLYLVRLGDHGQEILGFEVGPDSAVSANLPPGDHLLRIEEWNNDSTVSLYRLSLEVGPFSGDIYEVDNSPLSATPILPGVEQPGHSILPLGDRDWAGFTLTEPALVTARAEGASSDLVLYLRRFNGQTQEDIDFDVGPNAEVAANLPPGDFFLMVEDWYSDEVVEDYSLSLSVAPFTGDAYEPDNSPLSATTIVSGEIQWSHSILPVGDQDWATFTLETAGIVQARATGASREMVLYLIDFDGSGQRILQYDVGNSPSVEGHLTPGQFYLMAEDWDNDETVSSYSLEFLFTPEALAPLTPDRLLHCLLGQEAWRSDLDVNGDGAVDVADLMRLQETSD